MKRWMAGILCASLLLLAACGNMASDDLTRQVKSPDVEPEPLTGEAAAALTGFGLELLKQNLNKEENPLVSPASVAMALGMTANGARGQTLAQMEEVLGLPVEELNRALHAWKASLPATEKCSIHLANAIWLRDSDSLTVQQDFLQAAADWYGASAYKAPFDDSTVREINGWVKKNTKEMIPSIVNEIPQDAMLYLVNALAFEAEWATVYKEHQIRDWEFALENGEKETVDMMYSTERNYLEDENATGFLKYYAGRRYAIAALLPREGMTVEEYLDTLTAEGLRAMLTAPQDVEVRARMPAFEAEYSVMLNEALRDMGMEDAFSALPGVADFSAMGQYDGQNLYISEVAHKTYIKVDPKGTKAAAATAVLTVPSAAPAQEPQYKTVILERPFVYFLLDTDTGLPFFAGVMRDPG